VIAQIAKTLEYLENEPNYYLELPTIFSLTFRNWNFVGIGYCCTFFRIPKRRDKPKLQR
jgi:hypothetical protein